ncbi:uncharacterized protein [Temnothorax longispinosus]|uniref:uncharacterized protein n=1 Tax=Temnothorax longispinosus TaxID=300112 RepID=UPI003A9985B3
MAPTMSSRTAVRGIEFTLTLLLVSSAQAVNYEAHRHDVIVANEDDNIILTTRDFLEQLNFVAPKESYTLQEATEHLLQFGALLRARILDTFGSLLYVYYDDFSIAEVEALRKVYREILERRYDVFDLVPNVLKNQDTRPSRICAEIYDRATDTCLRSSASMCRRIRKQHDISHPDDRDTPALNVTYRMYRSSKISKQYPGGFSLATTLRFLQREALTITPNLLSGLLCNVRYENYDDDVRLAEKELVRHFHETTETEISIPTKELRKFHTVNSFLKHYIDTYAEKSLDNDLKKHAFLIARRITDDVGTIDENIHLLGNAYENGTIHIGYLFDLVLPDDLLENDVIEAKKYLVTKLNEFNVVEKYLRVQKYQQITPAQLTMEITGQLRDIDFAKSIATSLRMHARFWRGSRMIESLDDLLELFDSYENLRQVPRYARMMRKIDGIIESLRDMKDVPVEILCNAPRACLRIGLQLVLRCRFISSEIKEYIKGFLELSNVCIYPVIPPESRRSVEIPFRISKVRYSTAFQNRSTFIGKVPTPPSVVLHRSKTSVKIRVPTEPWDTTEFTSTITPMTTPIKPISTTHHEETTTPITSTTAATTTPLATTSPTTTTTLPTTTTTTTLPTTTTTLPTTTTTLSTTITTLPTTTTTSPTTTTTTLPTTTTTLSPTTTTTELPTTTTTTSPTTTTTALPTTTTTISPTTTTTALPTTTTTTSPTTTSTALPTTTTATTSPTVTTKRPTIDVKMKLKRSTVRTVTFPYDRKPTENVTVFITTPTPTTPCESIECKSTSKRVETTTALPSTTQSLTTTPTMQTSTPEITRTTSPGSPSTYRDFTEPTASSTTDVTPVTKGDCPKSCLERCRPKSESFEPPSRRSSCDTSCDSVTEDCEDDTSKDSLECKLESDGNCECPPKEDKSIECMTLCPPDSLSCEEAHGDCITSVVPSIDMKLRRNMKRTRSMCEIRDPHRRRQLKRLAKMRAISAASATVATSRVDVLRPTTSRHRDRIATKKLYNLLATKLPHSNDRKMAEYLLKRPHDGGLSGNDKDRRRRRQRKQVYRQGRGRLTRKFSGKLSRGATVHRTRGAASFRHSQIKRISGGDARSISA